MTFNALYVFIDHLLTAPESEPDCTHGREWQILISTRQLQPYLSTTSNKSCNE